MIGEDLRVENEAGNSESHQVLDSSLYSGHRSLGYLLVSDPKNLEETRRKSQTASHQGKKHTEGMGS